MFIDYKKKLIFFKNYRVMGTSTQAILVKLCNYRNYFLSQPSIKGGYINNDLNTYEENRIYSIKNYLINFYLKYI